MVMMVVLIVNLTVRGEADDDEWTDDEYNTLLTLSSFSSLPRILLTLNFF